MPNLFMLAALDYEAKGYSVIPLKPKDKIPLIPTWTQFQTERADREQIGIWWRTWKDANIGIVTGEVSGLFVIDCDSPQAATELKPMLGDMTATGIVATGKGFHLYYAHGKTNYPNKAAIKPHIDFRGHHGYVVAPPSIHANGRHYEWVKAINGHLRELPPEFIALMTAPPPIDGHKPSFDTVGAISGLSEGQRDTGMFKLACKLRGADVPYVVALELCEQAAANCEPPFRNALRKVDQAYKYPAGRSNSAISGTQETFWPSMIQAEALLDRPEDPTRWIWENCLPVSVSSMLVASPKVGKSTFAAALSICVSRGWPFLGRATQQGPVAYLSLDASFDEIRDVFIKFGLKASDPIFFHAGRAPVESLKWAIELMTKHSIRLLIVDTIQKMFRFKNINDYSEVTNVMEPLDEAARQQQCHIMYLHHAKKGAGDDLDSAVGTTALRGIAYTFLHLKRLTDSTQRIFRTDQRAGKNFDEIAISDGTDGFIEKTGSRDDAEVNLYKPKIIEFIKEQTERTTEREIKLAIGGQPRQVSVALRGLEKSGEINRIIAMGARGRKVAQWGLVETLFDEPVKKSPHELFLIK